MGNRPNTPHRENALQISASCPICGKTYPTNTPLSSFNKHIDKCLVAPKSVPVTEVLSSATLSKLGYGEKNQWLRQQLQKIKVPWQLDNVVLQFERDRIVEDSWTQLSALDAEGMRKEFQILFDGEIASDAGGVLKEWVSKLNTCLLSSETGLFRLTNTEQVSYRFHPLPSSKAINLSKLYGLLIGKALLESIPVNSPLSIVIYKQLLQRDTGFEDLKYINNPLYKGLKFMKENKIGGVMFESMAVVETKFEFQVEETVDLIGNGRNVPVTEENKAQYIELRTLWELSVSSECALVAFLDGFYTVIPADFLSHFSAEELELSICGLSFIDVSDWEEQTVYRGGYHKTHTVIMWFWQILQDFSQGELSKLLQFVTGTTRLPVEGFKALKTLRGEKAPFTVEAVRYDVGNPFPRAHTCFNRLDLPEYQSARELRKQLVYAIENHCEGFGIE